MKTGHETRKAFIDYFKKQGHTHVTSSRLIPENDDTLLFANAGMNQFKNVFLGFEKRDYKRAVSSQKCVRAGGKHNDLENVGHTARHHTFFEMLGNFSFGDYFKKDAIHFGWDFLVNDLGLPKDRLSVTVFRDDDDAADIWHKQESVPKDRILRFDEKDNFWMMGDTGPCGPCSEIFFDHGPKVGCGRSDCKVGCSCDRFVEIWNLVFMQFDQSTKGRTALPNPSIDTGAGLERLSAVLQDVHNNYDTDLFTPLTAVSVSRIQKNIDINSTHSVAATRVLADHARATAFLIADGALPSNEGRGYVLRRIMRRAMRYGRKLNTKESMLLPVVLKTIELMHHAFPELRAQASLIEKTVRAEEDRFFQTLDQGTKILTEEIEALKARKQKIVGGSTVFKLYDTFGFPMDLTRVIANEQNLTIDESGFENLMEKARETAKASWKGAGISNNEAHLIKLVQEISPTSFVGYDSLMSSGIIKKLSNGISEVSELRTAEHGFVILDQTPFYAESGGQRGDKGILKLATAQANIIDCYKLNNVFIHEVYVKEGPLKIEDAALLLVNNSERRSTARNHSATHLLHAALREVLGTHVSQAGSFVAPDRLRFDFTHTSPITTEQLHSIAQIVNQKISLSIPVEHREMNYSDALKVGAMALFGEKYGDKVRVIKISDFSSELCGGTHVDNTSDIRVLVIMSEAGVSAGVRRIEAITGDMAIEYLRLNADETSRARDVLGQPLSWTKQLGLEGTKDFKPLEQIIRDQQNQIKILEKEIKALKAGSVDVEKILSSAKKFTGGRLIFVSMEVDDKEVLSQLNDHLKDKISSGIVILIGKGQDTHPISVSVTKDLTEKFNASKILQMVTNELGGRGGGRPDFAQGAVKSLQHISDAIKKIEDFLN